MKILVTILQTIRPTSNHGGSSKAVKAICTDLATHGHQVTLLCGATTDNRDPFELEPGVRVRPELPFRQSWQDTWLVPPADLAAIVGTTMAHARDAERIVIFDSHLPYPDILPAATPLVWSLRDFTYVQALQGSLAFRRDHLVAPSEYIRRAFCDTVAPWLPGVEQRVSVIENGVDLRRFSPTDRTSARRALGVEGDPILLMPHRPEEAKGFSAAIELCRRTVAQCPDVRLLIPRGSDVTIMPEARRFYDTLVECATAAGIGDRLLMRDWLPASQVPLLYSAANVTLCVGEIVEASSNTALESLACGTPVVASNIACYRDFAEGILKVPVGDLDVTHGAIIDLLDAERPLDVTSLAERHDHRTMLATWRETIETATARPPLVPAIPSGERAKIPVWISDQGDSLYDEYRAVAVPGRTLRNLWQRYGRDPFRIDELDAAARRAAESLLASRVLVHA